MWSNVSRDPAKLSRALTNAGFSVVLDPKLSVAHEAATVSKAQLVETAKRRLAAAQERLRQRGIEIAPYQNEGVVALADKSKFLLSDDMGLGKTMQLIIAVPDDAAVIVVSPHSLKHNWKREIELWRPDLRVTVLEGGRSFRWPEPGEVNVLNYDILPGKVGEFQHGRSKRRSAPAAPAGW